MKFNEMPRSVAERIDRSSLSRASVGKGSLGRFSVATDISASSAATRHWVNSVSDIYGPDEIEDLLQDLNRLELATFNREDYREFDIDGSQLGGLDTFPVSPAKTPPNQDPPSPTLSVRSWDSHTHYQQFKEPPDDYWVSGPPGHLVRPLHAVVCYCDINLLKTPKTLLRVLVLITSVACFTSLLSAGTAKLSVSALPHITKLRILVVVSVFSAMFSLLVVFLNISHLHALLPMDYGKMQFVVYLVVGFLFLISSSLVLFVQISNSSSEYQSWIPQYSNPFVLASAILGYICGLEAFLCSFDSFRSARYQKMEESSTNFTLHETATSRAVTNESIVPRPNPPPAPRPIVRSQAERSGFSIANQNFQPSQVSQPYTNIVKCNLQPKHNGGRELTGAPVTLDLYKRSASPDTLYSPSVSQPGSPNFTYSGPGIPRSRVPTLFSRDLRSRFSELESGTFKLETSKDHSAQLNRDSGRSIHEKEESSLVNQFSTFNQISPRVQNSNGESYTKMRYSGYVETSDIDSSWDSKHGDNSHSVFPTSPARLRTSDVITNHTRRSSDPSNPLNNNSRLHCKTEYKNLHSDPSRETGAIPKTKKSIVPLSPVHPDQIISFPLDDLTPPTSAATKTKSNHNYAH